jgi:hypothetical protein
MYRGTSKVHILMSAWFTKFDLDILIVERCTSNFLDYKFLLCVCCLHFYAHVNPGYLSLAVLTDPCKNGLIFRNM